MLNICKQTRGQSGAEEQRSKRTYEQRVRELEAVRSGRRDVVRVQHDKVRVVLLQGLTRMRQRCHKFLIAGPALRSWAGPRLELAPGLLPRRAVVARPRDGAPRHHPEQRHPVVPLPVRLPGEAHGADVEARGHQHAVHVHRRLHDAPGEEQPQPRLRLLCVEPLRQRVRPGPLGEVVREAVLSAEDRDDPARARGAALLALEVLVDVEAPDHLRAEGRGSGGGGGEVTHGGRGRGVRGGGSRCPSIACGAAGPLRARAEMTSEGSRVCCVPAGGRPWYLFKRRVLGHENDARLALGVAALVPKDVEGLLC